MTEPALSRRAFVAGAAAATLGTRLPAPAGRLVHVGTYTADTASEGVYAFRMDPTTGALRALGAWDVGPNPSFLALHPTRRMLYAVNEVADFAGERTGAVSASPIDAAGALGAARRVASRGAAPCYLSVDATGRCALVANYSSGTVAALPIGADGRLGAATSVVQHAGRGPDASRQEGPHAHCILPDPTNRWALAADLGIDRVMVYRLDPRAATLTPAPTPFAALPAGAGPRHLAFHPAGTLLFVVCELDLTLASFRWDARAGTLAALHTVPLAPGLVRGTHTAADVHVAPSGRFVYASVRGDDAIVVFSVDARTGALAPVQHVSTGGRWPRNFALDPSGRFLLAANQKSNDLTTFRVDPATGRLTPTAARVEVPAPVCIRFGA